MCFGSSTASTLHIQFCPILSCTVRARTHMHLNGKYKHATSTGTGKQEQLTGAAAAAAAAAGPMQIIYRQIEAFWRAAARIESGFAAWPLSGATRQNSWAVLQLRHAYHL
ncbi:hypothetical protein THAR02_03685 [Trichoderma harzianum]|uniref:Uncharacterized protein n=1 Tax=Trichoderma harzianum TaxID=5544 RepID=A0A0G0AGW9_TRIHA|nr:hypothetical protein THAR02_03685 [Trichoderma harzianum]